MVKITKIFLVFLLFLKVGNVEVRAVEYLLFDKKFNKFDFFKSPQVLTPNLENILIINFSPNKFGFSELNKYGVGIIKKMDFFARQSNVGLFISGSNSDLFSRIKIKIPLSISLSKSFEIGITNNYQSFAPTGFPRVDSYSFDINGRYKLFNNINLGASFDNIYGNNRLFAETFSGAISWQNENLFTSFGFIILLDNKTIFYSSFNYQIAENINLKLAIANNPTVLNLGISLGIDDYKIISDFNYHKILGLEQNYLGEIEF
jgi:hypothetical protein